MTIFWTIALVLFGIMEAVTVGLVSLWFALGALVALIVAAVGGGLTAQIIAFLVVSTLALMAMRPLAKKYVNDRHVPTNFDRLIGKTAVVTMTIDNFSNVGQVQVEGQIWSARSATQASITEGAHVTVLRIEGVKLIVETQI